MQTNKESFAKDSERLKFAMNAAGIGVWEVDTVTNTVIWDDRCRELFGLSKENVIPYEEAIRFIHPDDLHGVNVAVQQALAGVNGGAYEAVYRTIGADDGIVRWVNFSGTAYLAEDGKLIRFGGVARDVTQETTAKRALRNSEKKYRNLFENMDQGFCIIEMIFDDAGDPVDYKFLEANPIFSSQTGLNNPIGRTARALVPDLEARWFHIYGEVARTGVSTRFVEGSETMGRWFDVYAFQVGEKGNHQVALLFTDISERIKNEAALKESEAFNRKALESSPDCVKILDTDGHLTFMNENGLCLMEIDDFATVKRQPWPNLWGEENRPVVQQALNAAVHGETSRFTAFCPTAKGTPKWWDVMVSPVIGEGNRVSQIISVSRDVSESREAKRLLEENELLLQQRVNERTAELADANKELIRSNDELAQYAYVASHDLQEPLRKIRVFSSQLQSDTQLSEKSTRLVSKIDASSARMSLLIRDLLDFSRLLKSDSLYRPVDLDQTVRDVFHDFELIAAEKQAALHLGKLPVVEAVGLQMNQLFYNLVSNALKYTRPGVQPVIEVSALPLTDAEVREHIRTPFPFARYFAVTVTDNGIGFEKQYANQIFEVFKRLHGRDTYSGSGIGLALCRRIVANHHGVLRTESTPGQGSQFSVILPDKQGTQTSDLPADLKFKLL